MEHEDDFIGSVYNDDDVNEDDITAPFNIEGPIQKWFVDKCRDVEVALSSKNIMGKKYKLLAAQYALSDTFEIDSSERSMRLNGQFIELDPSVDIYFKTDADNEHAKAFIAQIPGRIFKNESVENIIDRINTQFQNDKIQPSWYTTYRIDPRQLEDGVVPNYDLARRRQLRLEPNPEIVDDADKTSIKIYTNVDSNLVDDHRQNRKY